MVNVITGTFLVPGSCCSRVRCYTWSLEWGCTSYSSSLLLWHIPVRSTNCSQLSCSYFNISTILLSTKTSCNHLVNSSQSVSIQSCSTHRWAATVTFLSRLHEAITTNRRVQKLMGRVDIQATKKTPFNIWKCACLGETYLRRFVEQAGSSATV